MRTFRDARGRDWSLDITVNTVRRVRGDCGVNLLDIVDGELARRLESDVVLLCDMIFSICRVQAESKGVSSEDFGESLSGDVIDSAAKAFMESIVDFFPKPQQRQNLRHLLELTEVTVNAQQSAIAKKLEAMNADKINQLIEQQAERIDVEALLNEALTGLSGSSGNAPGSSGLIPGPTVSGA